MVRLNQSGEMFILAIIALGVVMVTTITLLSSSLTSFQNSKYSLEALQATNLAEAGIDRAVASLNTTGGTFSDNGETEYSLSPGTFTIKTINKDASTKIIESTGFIPNKQNSKLKRTVKIQISKGVGLSFVYGVQVGEGGLEMGNSNKVIGSVYSNGNILGSNSNEITGDVWVAGGVQPTPDQQQDCTSCTDYLFGKNISGEDIVDIAQSFKPATSAVLNKVSLKLKKFGNPSNPTVKILADAAGIPNKDQVLATGTLNSSLVTSNYSWVEVTFTSSPNLVAENSYWLMVDTSSDNVNFWSWQKDTLPSYTRGQPKWSPKWNVGNPLWNNIAGDLSFKTFIGGTATSINGGNSFTVGGNVRANTINNITIQNAQPRGAYYQSQTNLVVNGQNCTNNPSPPKCNPNSSDPPPQVMPISDANITDWKNQAAAAGNINTQDCNPATVWGPGKFTGNITFDNTCNETIKTPIWITGNFSLNNSNTLRLDSSFGASSGVIIVDGKSDLGNSNKLEGSGSTGSYLMLLSTFDSRTSAIPAIGVNNSGNSGVLYTGNGTIDVGNSNSFKEITAWKIKLNNSSTISYESGLASTFFSTGPSGSFSIIKGTYQSK